MSERLGFYFDQTRCTGCKACQIACKDTNDLPVGVLWRRVAEYAGGSWRTHGRTFSPQVFAYYVSMACNHCDDPVCTEVCPTTAMHRDDDGVIVVDEELCVGCRYCEWSCPYSAPQFDADAGHMTKCDLCADERAEGREPACVLACPSRALDWGPIDELRAAHGDIDAVEPLPDGSVVQPNLVIKPHRDAEPVGAGRGSIANPEEV